MISILNHWQQFSRLYFWSPLLSQMIAVRRSLPYAYAYAYAYAQDSSTLAEISSQSINISTAYAIRAIICYFLVILAPTLSQLAHENHQLPLLNTLNVLLLTHETRPHLMAQPWVEIIPRYQTELYLAQFHGIRAGPYGTFIISNNY